MYVREHPKGMGCTISLTSVHTAQNSSAMAILTDIARENIKSNYFLMARKSMISPPKCKVRAKFAKEQIFMQPTRKSTQIPTQDDSVPKRQDGLLVISCRVSAPGIS